MYFSKLSIAMLPEHTRQRVFKTDELSSHERLNWEKSVTQAALKTSGLENEPGSTESDIEKPFAELFLPQVHGKSILEHFEFMGENLISSVESRINRCLAQQFHGTRPDSWSGSTGWTCYDRNTYSAKNPGNEEFLIFDVEVNVATSQYYPVMATAYAPLTQRWYSWNRSAKKGSNKFCFNCRTCVSTLANAV